MLLLLLMYLSPVFAVSLYWYAQRTVAGATALETLGAAAQARLALLRPTAGAFLFAAAVVALAIGARGGVAFLFGAMTAAVAAALASSASDAALEAAGEATSEVAPPSALPSWTEASALALSLAAVATGCIGALAWFFADPAGAVVLVAFACGASAAALFLAMVVGTIPAARRATEGEGTARSTLAVSATASLHSHLPALAAALMLASTAEPESLLPLGGLLAETETLRSELLLLPIAISVLSPVVALMAAPFLASLGRRRGESSLYDLERVAALLALLTVTLVASLSGLAWAVPGAFAAGLAARQLAVLADEARSPVRAVLRPGAPPVAPALLSAAALLVGDSLAGWYGIALAALGMTATYATTAACEATREFSSLGRRANKPALPVPADLSLAEATATIAATLALLIATGPVIASESVHRGVALLMVATAAPALLIGVVAGAAGAQGLSRRFAEPQDEADAVRQAAQAVAIAAGLPALAGASFGAGAAVGVALGFAAWAVASAPLAARGELEETEERSRTRMPNSVLLAWGRTMALAALVGAPLMN